MHDTKLEKYLESIANPQDQFPNGRSNYFQIYKNMKDHLNNKVYDDINPMLAYSGNIYTDHGKNHVNSVIRAAGILLSEEQCKLNGYEIFLLLSSILIHDVGNIYGRKGHEKQGFEIINQNFPKMIEKIEAKIIAQIAGVHGGETNDGDKDTISKIDSKLIIGSITIRPQMIAAILRFADEISENSERSNNAVLEQENPPECVMYHKYASCIQGCIYEGDALLISYSIEKKDLMRKWQKDSKKYYLIDEILERIYKIYLEKMYCLQFTADLIKINKIHATISIYNTEDIINDVTKKFITIESDTRYPKGDRATFKKNHINITGKKIKQELS